MPNPGTGLYPDAWTGFTQEQQNHFLGLHFANWGAVPPILYGLTVPPNFPPLWIPALREGQLSIGYVKENDLVWHLSSHPPSEWFPLVNEVLRWSNENTPPATFAQLGQLPHQHIISSAGLSSSSPYGQVPSRAQPEPQSVHTSHEQSLSFPVLPQDTLPQQEQDDEFQPTIDAALRAAADQGLQYSTPSHAEPSGNITLIAIPISSIESHTEENGQSDIDAEPKLYEEAADQGDTSNDETTAGEQGLDGVYIPGANSTPRENEQEAARTKHFHEELDALWNKELGGECICFVKDLPYICGLRDTFYPDLGIHPIELDEEDRAQDAQQLSEAQATILGHKKEFQALSLGDEDPLDKLAPAVTDDLFDELDRQKEEAAEQEMEVVADKKRKATVEKAKGAAAEMEKGKKRLCPFSEQEPPSWEA